MMSKILHNFARLLVATMLAPVNLAFAQTDDFEQKTISVFGEAYTFEAAYTFDFLANIDGGLERGSSTLDNLDLTLSVDAEKLFGWNDVEFFLYGLRNTGGQPNARYVGSAQGVDNIEVDTHTSKIYEAWIQKNLWQQKLSLLGGLYDLNSEFYVTETSGLFLNASPGIGPEFSQTGHNGPSIFPTTSVAFRARIQPTPGFYFQSAILDGVPGDPDNPQGTHIQFNDGDGVLIVSELAYLRGTDEQAIDPELGFRTDTAYGKYALGWWFYTAEFDHLTKLDSAGNPVQHHNRGVYLLAEQVLSHEPDDTAQGLAMFLRYGIATAQVNQFDDYLELGAVYTGLIPGRDQEQLGLTVATAGNGGVYHQLQSDLGTPVHNRETLIELTYTLNLTPWFSVQPLIQYVIHPNTDPQLDNATVIGFRCGFSFSG